MLIEGQNAGLWTKSYCRDASGGGCMAERVCSWAGLQLWEVEEDRKICLEMLVCPEQ